MEKHHCMTFHEQRRLEKSVNTTVQSGSQAEVERNGFALLLGIIKPSALFFSTPSSFVLHEQFYFGHRVHFYQYEFVELNLKIIPTLL